MADAITIQELIDARTDAKSLEEVVNGNDTKQVTTRLGETYPSVKKAIKTMFENGGLPAEPFATKALMQTEGASLADGQLAQVYNEAANNGLYVKTAGAWVKSDYDPLALAKAYHDSNTVSPLGVSESVKLEPSGKVGYYTAEGVFTSKVGSSVSNNIKVEKGDCFVIKGLPIIAAYDVRSVFTMVDAEGEFLYSLNLDRNTVDKSNNDLLFDMKVGKYSSSESYKNHSVIIPEDGFMRVTTWHSTSPDDPKPVLFKTDMEGFCANSLIQVPCHILKSFEGILHSPKLDAELDGANGRLAFTNGLVVGTPLGTAALTGSISSKIAISKGQFIHLHLSTMNARRETLVFEDALGNYLGTQNIVSEHSFAYEFSGSVSLNMESQYTGFMRIASYSQNTIPTLWGVTDNKVIFEDDYLVSGQVIDFHRNKSKTSLTSLNTNINKYTIESLGTSPSALSASYTVSRPYLLRKGDVLEYGLEATNYATLAVVYPKGDITKGSLERYDKSLPLNATEVFDMEQGRQWLLSGKAATPVYFANAQKGKVAYCDEDKDLVIIFLRPSKSSTQFSTYKQSEHHTVNVMSKSDYILKRNKEISDRFTQLSKLTTTGSAFDNHNPDISLVRGGIDTAGSYPPVLMFKGEVLSYLTNNRASHSSDSLDKRMSSNSLIVTTALESPVASSPAFVNIREAYNALPITEENKFSHRYNQIYCHSTCIVTPYINYLTPDFLGNLDTEGLIENKHYAARVINIKDIVLGENIEPTFNVGGSLELRYNDVSKTYSLGSGASDKVDNYQSFLPKGSSIEMGYWAMYTQQSPIVAKIERKRLTDLGFEYVSGKDSSGVVINIIGQEANYKYGITLTDDSVVSVDSQTNPRGVEGLISNAPVITPNNLIMVDTYEHSLKSIPAATVRDKYTVTSEDWLNVPITSDIKVNFCTINGTSLDSKMWCTVQLLSGKDVIAVFNAKSENQGQSTASLSRKNVEIELYNDKFDKVMVKFGRNIEESSIILKSYLTSDKGHFKEALATDFWHDIRTAQPYPVGGVFPKHVFSDLSSPTNQSAKGTTFCFPTELHRGGNFHSLATIRNKKKRENYAVDKNNSDHILMQADYSLNGTIDWATITIANMDIRNPSMSGYESGDVILPDKFIGVQTEATRIIEWMKACYNGTAILKDTYSDYIDLKSFIDYYLMCEVSLNWDSMINNFLIATHDSHLWYVYMYDADRTWGEGDIPAWESPTEGVLRNSFFKKVVEAFPTEVQEAYNELRSLGVIDARRLQDKILEINGNINSYSKIQDAKYWGGLDEKMGIPYVMEWIKLRIDHLDTKYGYI